MEHLSGEQPLSLMLLTPPRMQNVRGEKNAVGGCQTLISSSLKPLSPDQIQLSVWSSGAETSPGEVCSRDGTETKSEAQSFYNSRGCHVKGTVHCSDPPTIQTSCRKDQQVTVRVYHILVDCSFKYFSWNDHRYKHVRQLHISASCRSAATRPPTGACCLCSDTRCTWTFECVHSAAIL